MLITDILSQIGGLQSIARELGVSEAQAASGAAALGPSILSGLKKQAQTHPAGLEGLGGLLNQLGGGGLLDQVLSPQPTDVSQGNNVLGQIFGSKDVSRAVAQNASTQSGLEPGLLQKMLPMLAMLISGYLAKEQTDGAEGGGVGGLLGGLLGGTMGVRGPSPTPGAGLPGLLQCSTRTARATRWTTSWEWPARPGNKRRRRECQPRFVAKRSQRCRVRCRLNAEVVESATYVHVKGHHETDPESLCFGLRVANDLHVRSRRQL